MSITAFVPAFKGSCPTVPRVYLYRIPAQTVPVPGYEDLFASYLLFLEVSKEEKLQREEWEASPERMEHLVPILFAWTYAALVCSCLMSP